MFRNSSSVAGSSTPGGPGICPNCNTKPVAVNPATGQYFEHCSRSCAMQANRGQSQNGSSVSSLCEQCGQRPRFKEHAYCGRTCARLAASTGSTQATSPGSICQTPGCTSPVFVGANGVAGKYCRARTDGGENTVASLAALLRGTVRSSCVSLVMTRPCARHQSSSKYPETTRTTRTSKHNSNNLGGTTQHVPKFAQFIKS